MLAHPRRRLQHADEVGAGGTADAPAQARSDIAHRRQAQRIRHLDHRIDAAGDEARFHPRPADALDARPAGTGQAGVVAPGQRFAIAFEEHRHLRIRAQDAGGVAAVAHVAAERGGGAAGAGAAHDPCRHRMRLFLHLPEDRFGDVVVGAPVGGTLGVQELVHEVAAALARQLHRIGVQVAGAFDQVAAPALEFDRGDLFRRGGRRHHRDERQPQQAREIGFGHRGGAAGGLDHRPPLVQPAVGQRVQEQRTRQAVLEAAGGMAGLVLEIQINARETGQLQRNQVGVGRAVEIGFDLLDGVGHPIAIGHDGTQDGKIASTIHARPGPGAAPERRWAAMFTCRRRWRRRPLSAAPRRNRHRR